jgi:hypothetical protein
MCQENLFIFFEGICPVMYTEPYFFEAFAPTYVLLTLYIFTSLSSYGSHFYKCLYMCMCVQHANIRLDYLEYLSFDLIS